MKKSGRIEEKKIGWQTLYIPVLPDHHSRGFERRFQAERVLQQWMRTDLRLTRAAQQMIIKPEPKQPMISIVPSSDPEITMKFWRMGLGRPHGKPQYK